MATGVEMMLKSMLGIDPVEIKNKLEEGLHLIRVTLSHFDQRMRQLETQNAEILTLLKGTNHDKQETPRLAFDGKDEQENSGAGK